MIEGSRVACMILAQLITSWAHEPQQKLGCGFKYFLFSTLFGEMIQFD